MVSSLIYWTSVPAGSCFLRRIPKGQLISKCFFGVFTFFQKTNENKSTSSKDEFVRSFFGRNVSWKKSFRLCLTFTTLKTSMDLYSWSWDLRLNFVALWRMYILMYLQLNLVFLKRKQKTIIICLFLRPSHIQVQVFIRISSTSYLA